MLMRLFLLFRLLLLALFLLVMLLLLLLLVVVIMLLIGCFILCLRLVRLINKGGKGKWDMTLGTNMFLTVGLQTIFSIQ